MRFLLIFLIAAFFAQPTFAEVALTGYFTATKTCPALQSIGKQTNPGNILTHPGRAYDLIAGNTATPTYLWIVIPGASPDRRWVAVDCGTRATDAEGQIETPPPAPAPTYRGTQYILAVSWEPAFCETSPNKAECRSQDANRFDARHLSLHGLWPQPRDNEYCDVTDDERWSDDNGRWRDLPEVNLSAGLRRELDEVMPGTSSQLERHEWTRHGTCYGATQEEYFSDAVDLMLAINTSPVADLFAANIGRKITLRQVREAFDIAFGPGAGDRVRLACEPDGNRQIITELTIGHTGTITGPDDFATLIAAASPTDGGCTSGMVDPVGNR